MFIDIEVFGRVEFVNVILELCEAKLVSVFETTEVCRMLLYCIIG